FYENTTSLGKTYPDDEGNLVIELNKKLFSENYFEDSKFKIYQVMIKEYLRLLFQEEQIALINKKFGVDVSAEDRIKFEAYLEVLSYAMLEEKFLDVWDDLSKANEYLYDTAKILANDNVKLREVLGIKEPFNFKQEDIKLIEMLKAKSAKDALLEDTDDFILSYTESRLSA
ncbi:hypothetical protein KKC59_02420, partial [bacterium]|nr:hypothetical protein [bacterium]